MRIVIAQSRDKQNIARLDSHIPSPRLDECIRNGQIYVLEDDSSETEGIASVVGVLRFSLFWQTLPFVDLLYIDEAYRNRGCGGMDISERTGENGMKSRLCGEQKGGADCRTSFPTVS